MILKVGMDYGGLKVYKVSINYDPGLTLTYFMAKSNLVKIAYCTYTRPSCQVSVYRTIGPLVDHHIKFNLKSNHYKKTHQSFFFQMTTQRAIFFATALNMLAAGADQNIQQMEHIANNLSTSIDRHHIPSPTNKHYPIHWVDHYAEQFLPTDSPDDFLPLIASSNGNCLYNSVSLLLVGNESMSSELRVRTSLALLQLKDYFMKSDSQAVTDMIKEQLLLYSPYAEHDYRLNNKTVTQNELEMVLINEIHNTVTDKKWSGMWQIQALATSIDMAILSVYPSHNLRIRSLFHKLVTPLFHAGETIHVLPVMWSGYTANNLFTANHFVPLVHKTCLLTQTVDSNNEIHDCSIASTEQKSQTHSVGSYTGQTNDWNVASIEQKPQTQCTEERKVSSNITDHSNYNPATQKVRTDPQISYHCLSALPQYFCSVCETLICTQKPKTHIVQHKTTFICSFCHRCIKQHNQSPLQKDKIYPGDIPKELMNLTSVEINLISQIHPYMNLLKLPVVGQFAQRGQSINIPIPVQELYTSLPRTYTDNDPYILLSNPKNKTNKHIINKDTVSKALQWLIKNNTLYKDVSVSMKDICEKPLEVSCEDTLFHQTLPKTDHSQVMLNIRETVSTQPHPIQHSSECCDSEKIVSNIHDNKRLKMEIDEPLMEYSNNTLSQEIKVGTLQTKDPNTCESQNENSNVQQLSMIPTDYIIPLNNKKDIQATIPTFTIPFFEGQPINIFQHKNAEELGFPHLFPYGNNGFKSLTNPVTPHQYFTCRILNKDKRWATNIQYLFWALNVYEQHTLQNSISIALRIDPKSSTQLNAQSILTEQYSKHVQEDFRFMKHIKGTASYWRDQLYNLIAKINTLGPPTFFFVFEQ